VSYVITFFDREGPGRRYLFPERMYDPVTHTFLSEPQMAVKMMEWLEGQPIVRALTGQEIPFAWTAEHQSSITVRDLTDDEIVLLIMSGTPNMRIVHDSRLRKRERPLHDISTEGTQYRRDIAKKRDPATYEIVKRPARRRYL
jgi:hypothetical protein